MNEHIFKDELLQGEKILWTGQPDPSIHFAKGDVFLVPFSILWGSFALFWEGGVLLQLLITRQAAFIPFTIFGIPFVVVGLYFICGRFLLKAKKKKNTYYAVTDKRVLSLTHFFGKHFDAAFINSIPSINKSIKANGVGTLVFGNTNPMTSMYGNAGMDLFSSYYGESAPTFYDIKDAERIYQQVSQLRNAGQSN